MKYRLTLLMDEWLPARTECEKDLQDSKKAHDKLLNNRAIRMAMKAAGNMGEALIGAPRYNWSWEKNVLDFSMAKSLTSSVIKDEAFDGTVVQMLSGYGKSKVERVEKNLQTKEETAVLLWEGEDEITDEELKKKFPKSGLEAVKGVPQLGR